MPIDTPLETVPPTVVDAALPLLGTSEMAVAARLALADALTSRGAVLLTGPPGLRPEDIARAVHAASSPASPFIAIDCSGAIAADIDHRLFGSGARRVTQELEVVGEDAAVFAVGSGTLYLEHVDELPASAQRRLARVLRDGEIAVANAERSIVPAAFRLVGATTKDLEVEAREGRFRTELLRRFSGRIAVPSLRQRPQDIPAIVQRIASVAGHPATITAPALTILAAMPWPGNLDELTAVFRRILVTTSGVIRQEDVISHLPIQGGFTRPDLTASLRDARRQFERDYIEAVLERHHWRMAEAARTLGIERANLYRKTRQLGITRGTRSEAPAVSR